MREQVGFPRRRPATWPATPSARWSRTAGLPAGEPSFPPVAGWEPRYRAGVLLGDVLALLAGVVVVGGAVTAYARPGEPWSTR
ncbi:hypothetical protein ACFQV2_36890 [Actinokineospora soli]|uniref:Uncharacterized protein n=1 Tax=Actinokineospora soli TaxID=1048753 RepID=A0ABW2TZF6_9PSEU